MSIEPHTAHPFRRPHVIRDFVVGLPDGLILPFALAAGLSGAGQPAKLIIIAGLAEIAAGAIALGVGGYLAGKTEMEYYTAALKKEYDEAVRLPSREQEVRNFFGNLGLSGEVQEQAVAEMTKDKRTWVDFMMKYELGPDKPDPARARKSAFNIGLSYFTGGLIPLSPYFFPHNGLTGLMISALITLTILFIFGYFKSRLTGLPAWQGAIRITLIGAVAAACAFGIARMIV